MSPLPSPRAPRWHPRQRDRHSAGSLRRHLVPAWTVGLGQVCGVVRGVRRPAVAAGPHRIAAAARAAGAGPHGKRRAPSHAVPDDADAARHCVPAERAHVPGRHAGGRPGPMWLPDPGPRRSPWARAAAPWLVGGWLVGALAVAGLLAWDIRRIALITRRAAPLHQGPLYDLAPSSGGRARRPAPGSPGAQPGAVDAGELGLPRTRSSCCRRRRGAGTSSASAWCCGTSSPTCAGETMPATWPSSCACALHWPNPLALAGGAPGAPGAGAGV